MKMIKLFLSSVIFILTTISVSSACVCSGQPSVAETVKAAKVVFSGKVIARGKFGSWFKIEKGWKGVSTKTIYIFTGNIENDCSSLYKKIGERWLIYAYLDPLYNSEKAESPYAYKLMTRACGRTTRLVNAQEDLKELAAI